MMSRKEIIKELNLFDGLTGNLQGKDIIHSVKRLKDLKNVFYDDVSYQNKNLEDIAYEVDFYAPEKEGTPGGLFFGVSTIYPGLVGDEYFMTRGHFHAVRHMAEFYWGIEGEGLLVLMKENRTWEVKKVEKGSLHYICGHTAHRLVNTTNTKLKVGACWPTEAGHDYNSIEKDGFSVRVLNKDNNVTLEEHI